MGDIRNRKGGRDDFPAAIKEALAKRVGFHCSSPDCGRATIGPSDEKATATASVGVAAHITAAAPGGRRYDPTLTREQRGSIENGIWLCATCATLVDRDEVTYPVEALRAWRTVAEHRAKRNLAGKTSTAPATTPSGKIGYSQIRDRILDEPPERFVMKADYTDETRFTYRDDLDLEIVVRDDEDRDFTEQWIYRFIGNRVPPKPAKKSIVDIRYAGKTYGEFVFLWLDDFRYLLPLPSAGAVQQIDPFQAALGRIIARTTGRSFDEGLAAGGFVVVDEHFYSQKDWLRPD